MLRAQAALFRLARREGFAALEAHSDWATSPILKPYARLGATPGAAKLLCESLMLLGANLDKGDFEAQLDAWIEIEAVSGRLDLSSPIVRCIVDSTLALHGGARATQAIRIGRGRLPAADRLETTNLTDVTRALDGTSPPGDGSSRKP